MKSKILLCLFGLAILVSSCSSGSESNLHEHKIVMSESSEMNSLKRDVILKSSGMNSSTLMNLAFTDFAFDADNRKTVAMVYNTTDPGKAREILLSDPNFLKCCFARGLDTSDIPAYVYLNKNLAISSPGN